jgi:hypothetical protein
VFLAAASDLPAAAGSQLSTGEATDMLNTSRSSSEQAKVAVVRAMYEAYVNKDRAAIEPLLADAFHFTSPLDNRIDRALYFERCWPLSQQVEWFDFVAVVPAGNRVFVLYEGRHKGGKRFRNAEVCLFQGEQVVEVEVYFGWSIPHQAAPGAFVDAAAPGGFVDAAAPGGFVDAAQGSLVDSAPPRSLGELPG